MLCFVGAGFLFGVGNLFTSQRLAWYGAGLMFVAVSREIFLIIKAEIQLKDA
jgi:hypothetical protein